MYLHNAAESQLKFLGLERFLERLRSAFEFYEEKRKENKIQYYGMATWNCFRVSPKKKKEHVNLETVVKLAEDVGGLNHGFRFVQIPFNIVMP